MGYAELVKKLRHDSLLCIEPLHSELAEAADAIDTLQRACANYAEQAEELQAAVDGYEATTDEARTMAVIIPADKEEQT